MKPAWLGAVIGAAVFAACFVDRPSEQFACKTTADCSGFPDNRQCTSGFCVVPNCPSDCTSCDEVMKTCTAECSSADTCGFVTCPSGWTCTINCSGDNACDNVTCQNGSTCSVACIGTGACGSISCRDACACDVTCAAGACGVNSCPTATGGVRCTVDGTNATPCDSTPQGCMKC